MRIVVAVGGNALLRRGQALSAANQLANVRRAARQLARVAVGNQMVLTHGNGPQVGLLALQAAAYTAVPAYPLDVLGAETEGMLGYLLEQELGNLLPARPLATLITRTEVSRADPAFKHPTKPIGPMYAAAQAARIAAERGWVVAPDGTGDAAPTAQNWRRVVASPMPVRVLELMPIQCLLDAGVLVIAAGGGGVPVVRAASVDGTDNPALEGIEAVIDKDHCAGLLARQLDADCLLIATDVSAVFLDFGQSGQRPIGKVSPGALLHGAGLARFAAGSMGPKVAAACAFVTATGRRAVIGSLDQIESMLQGVAGTQISLDGAHRL